MQNKLLEIGISPSSSELKDFFKYLDQGTGLTKINYIEFRKYMV